MGIMIVMMVVMMALGIGVVVVISIFFAVAVVSETAKGKRNQNLVDDVTEKPKRSRLMLSDDGELVDWLPDEGGDG